MPAPERIATMQPGTISAYHAEAHCQDLQREARQAALAAEARSGTNGTWRAALLLASDLLLATGHRRAVPLSRSEAGRLRPLPAERPLFYAHRVAAYDITVVRPLDDSYAQRIACLET
jgi:hypothetical protein